MKLSITVNDLTPDQTIAIATAAKAADDGKLPGKTAGTYANGTAAPSVNGVGTTSGSDAPRGPRMPRVDADAVDAAATPPKKTDKAEAAPKKKAAPAPEPEEEEEEEAAPPPKKRAAAAEAAPPKKKAAAPRVEDDEDEEPADEGDGDVDPRIMASGKLSDIVKILQGEGFEDEDAIVEECVRLRPSVPLLQRISDIPGRVHRTMEVVERGTDRV